MFSPKKAFVEAQRLMKYRKVPFFIVFFIAVLLSYSVLFALDFIPEPLSPETKALRAKEREEAAKRREVLVATEQAALAEVSEVKVPTEEVIEMPSAPVPVEPVTEASTDALPTRIIIDTLGVNVKVLNPQARDIASLDNALLSGVVRHPDSASFAKSGNMLILGHSSYLPNVMNKNFQAFNGIQKMTWGDKIRVQSEGKEYIYRVQKVYQAKASELVVPLTHGKAMLTLATCNSFGSKEDRFIVEANLIETNDL